MTLSRAGSRRVTVDGVVFRWRIRDRPTHAQAAGAPMTLALQRDGCRSVLVVDLVVPRPDGPRPHQTQVTPARVREMIRAAMVAGWVPESDTGLAMRHALIMDA